jgi:hypothetical protein
VKLYVLFAQRKCRYEGEYAPEALDVCDEFSHGENPDYLFGKLQVAQDNTEFVSAAIVAVDLGEKGYQAILDRLTGITTVNGSVTDGES